MTTRLSVNIADGTAAALQALSDKHGTSLTETVRRAVSVYAGVAEQWDEHRKVLVRDGDVLYELTFEEGEMAATAGVAARPTVAAPGDVAPAETDEEAEPVAVVGLYRGEQGIERMEIALGLAAARLVVERWEVQRYDGPIQMWRRMPHGAAECVLAGTGR